MATIIQMASLGPESSFAMSDILGNVFGEYPCQYLHTGAPFGRRPPISLSIQYRAFYKSRVKICLPHWD